MRTESDARIRLIRGDLTEQEVDAIVNAANSSLMGGGGVDGAIHRRGGPAILAACREIVARQGGCKTGDAVLTIAGDLPARFVIHAVGPRWRGGTAGEPRLLESAYRSSLRIALEHNLRTVAFPSISTGIYGFPVEQAAPIALQTIRRFMEEHPGALDEVRMVLFSERDLEAYRSALASLQA